MPPTTVQRAPERAPLNYDSAANSMARLFDLADEIRSTVPQRRAGRIDSMGCVR